MKTLLFDDKRESFAQTDELGDEELLDSFDSEAIFREESDENFAAGGAKENLETSLSSTYVLGEEDVEREQTESLAETRF